MIGTKHDSVLRTLVSPAVLIRRGEHIGGPSGHEEKAATPAFSVRGCAASERFALQKALV